MQLYVKCSECEAWYQLSSCETEFRHEKAVAYYCLRGHHIATLKA